MKEDFLHYLWKFQKFSSLNLKTTDGESIQVLQVGTHNTYSDGPDFSAAQLIIDDQKWAGNVEIHVKSSDWFAHSHQIDPNYDSVILHVVWEHDVDVYRQTNTKIPSLELKNYVSAEALSGYKQLYLNAKERWINCENQLGSVSEFTWENWLERLYFERLEEKSKPIIRLLNTNKNNWEATCFCLLAKAFGGNTNGESFFRIAQSVPFSIIQKETSVFKLEALLFGQAGLLSDETEDSYEKMLYDEYFYLKKKFKLITPLGVKVQFYRLRPPNFPTIRLSQLAVLYVKYNDLFNRLSESKTIENVHKIFFLQASSYWKTHYNFGKESKTSVKKITAKFIDIILLNSVLPLRFLYARSKGNLTYAMDDLLNMISLIGPEKNNLIDNYKKAGIKVTTALHSQALLTLHKNYCNVGNCLQCSVGISILDSYKK